MEAKKYTIADKEFTFKFPSFKRTQKVETMLGETVKTSSDWTHIKEIFQTMFEEDVNILDENYENDTVGLSDLMGAQNDFFMMTAEMPKKLKK